MTGGNGRVDLPHRILVLADPSVLGPTWVDRVAQVEGEGLPWICLRTPGASAAERSAGIRALRHRCPDAVVVGYDDPVVAEAAGVSWLHLPGRRLEDLAAIGRAHPGLRIGVSCHRTEELVRASAAGAAYALLSPVFDPGCKPSVGSRLGVEGVRRSVREVVLPVLALGGVTPDRIPAVAGSGAAGAAVLGSLFTREDDLANRARKYRRAAESGWPGAIHGEHR